MHGSEEGVGGWGRQVARGKWWSMACGGELWVDNDNVVLGLQGRLGRHGAEAVWEEAENSSEGGGDAWRVQEGDSTDGDVWEAMELLLASPGQNRRRAGGALAERAR